MLNKITFFFSMAIAVGCAVSLYVHIIPSTKDEALYREFVRSMVEFRSSKALEKEPAHQTRRTVQKDVWTAESGKRSHIRLKGLGSDLWIKQSKHKVEITEHLQSIEYCMQKGEEIRWMTAQEGTYLYPDHQLTAINGELSLYSAEGTELPSNRPSGPCFMNISADAIDFNVKDLLRLTGNVKLFTNRPQEKEMFALANELIYDLRLETMCLKGTNNQKVLFWQDDVKMSARELQIQKDHLVKGFGDVHFSFDMEEERIFHEIFERWL